MLSLNVVAPLVFSSGPSPLPARITPDNVPEWMEGTWRFQAGPCVTHYSMLSNTNVHLTRLAEGAKESDTCSSFNGDRPALISCVAKDGKLHTTSVESYVTDELAAEFWCSALLHCC